MDVEKELKASQEDCTKFPEKEAVGSPECDTPPVGKVGKSKPHRAGGGLPSNGWAEEMQLRQ